MSSIFKRIRGLWNPPPKDTPPESPEKFVLRLASGTYQDEESEEHNAAATLRSLQLAHVRAKYVKGAPPLAVKLAVKILPRGGYWRRLPVELCSMIFELCAPEGSDEDDGWKKACRGRGSDYPVILCLVCKSWRTVACTTPRIWSSIALIKTLHRPFLLERAMLWFIRSKSAPLHFYFETVDHPSDLINQMLSLLRQYIPRCARLHIQMDSWHFDKPLKFLRRPAPLLRQCSITFPSWSRGRDEVYEEDPQPLADSIFNGISPALVCLQIPDLRINWPASILHNLTTLHIAHGGDVSLNRILAICDLPLMTLSLHQYSISLVDHSNPPIVVNSSIQNLSLICDTVADATAVLNKLALPTLRSLNIATSFGSDDIWLERDDENTTTSQFPMIISLNLDISIPDGPFAKIINRMANLRTLHVDSWRTLGVLNSLQEWEAIVDPPGGLHVVFPRLRSLTVNEKHDSYLLRNTISTFVDAHKTLTSVTILSITPVDERMAASLASERLVVHLKSAVGEDYDSTNRQMMVVPRTQRLSLSL